ncbi:MAG: SCO family protein [Pyrinomonadaceae bacterium]|nr:SCO family protein [Pyrinomonadaceae bacterium]
MKPKILYLLILHAILFAACEKQVTSEVKRYPLKGEVLSVDKENRKASIKHEKIDGYMEAMTMDFPIREDWVWGDLAPGAEIRAELVVDDANAKYWLERIAIVAAPNPDRPAPPVNENFAQVGSELADFTLTNQDGKKISPKDFRGKALAITFIYSRCPLPEYCILMSKNFSDAANKLAEDPVMKDKARLLSISFDPATDTPEKLREYRTGYLGKNSKAGPDLWQLATGPDKDIRKIADSFGLRYEVDEKDKTQFNHSLRTVVVGPDGKITKIFGGNEWTTDQLLSEMQRSLQADEAK